jgi:membrane protein YdbS with pleckstrin-like domain
MATGTGKPTNAHMLFLVGVAALVGGILTHSPEWVSWAGVAAMLLAVIAMALP